MSPFRTYLNTFVGRPPTASSGNQPLTYMLRWETGYHAVGDSTLLFHTRHPEINYDSGMTSISSLNPTPTTQKYPRLGCVSLSRASQISRPALFQPLLSIVVNKSGVEFTTSSLCDGRLNRRRHCKVGTCCPLWTCTSPVYKLYPQHAFQ